MLAMHLLTWVKGKFVGEDIYGNRYFVERIFFKSFQRHRPRRWVMYKGIEEASKVTPEWHGWLHFSTDQSPPEQPLERYEWQKPYQPNLTGTEMAYNPRVFTQKVPDTKHYQPWIPARNL